MAYEYKECSLKEKEDFFKNAYAQALGKDESNAGKVPIWMAEDGRFITESAIVYAPYIQSVCPFVSASFIRYRAVQ